MSLLTKTANDIFAPYDIAGMPRPVDNRDAQVWGTEVEAILRAGLDGDGYIYETKAIIDGALAPVPNSKAWVVLDPVAANNGIYQKFGASGEGYWERRADLPYSFIEATDVGAGTPNAIQATTSIPVSDSALVLLNIFETNTASPVTVSYNGGSALTIKTNSGNDPAPGGLTGGMIVLGNVSGSTFRLVNDQVSSAVVAAAEAAAAAAAASAASVPAEVAKRVIEFDLRMSQFAGGAPMNGVDDDQPAIQAAVDYCKTLGGRYTGGTPFIRFPAGQIKTNQTVDVTGADNVVFQGDGDGATRFSIAGNFAGIYANDPVSQPLQRFGVKDMTIQGPGYTNNAAYGIRLGANNNCTIAARIWACRRALSLANSWQTNILNIRFDGQASLANYDGLYLEDGDSSVVENSVLIMGGLIQGCKRYGFRGESVSGSKVFGLEVLGCENTGVYIGESPTGKDLKWFSWIGGVIDTCTDLLVVKKGTSSLAYEVHFSGMWLGYAYEGLPGVGVGVEFNGLTDSSIQADMVVNMGHVFLLKNCTACSAEAKVIRDYDRLLQGGVAILLENTRDSYVHARTARKQTGSPATEVIKETGTSDYNIIGEGRLDGVVTLVGAHSKKSSAIIEG